MRVALDEGAYVPTRAHHTDAGYDLRSPKDAVLKAGKSLAEYDPEEHAYNGPLNDEWVSAGVAHSVDFKEINEDFYHPDWVRGYDI